MGVYQQHLEIQGLTLTRIWPGKNTPFVISMPACKEYAVPPVLAQLHRLC